MAINSREKSHINHLLYVDDWNVFAESTTDLDILTDKIGERSESAGLKLNAKKCAYAVIRDGKLQDGEALTNHNRL